MAWQPGKPIPNPPFVLAAEWVFNRYHRERAAIDRLYSPFELEPETRGPLRRAALEALEAQVLQDVSAGQTGCRLIPIRTRDFAQALRPER